MCFPACGKSYLFEKFKENEKIKALDSDSTNFSWIRRKRTKDELEQEIKRLGLRANAERIALLQTEDIKVRNPEFPTNYIKHIKENIGKVDFIFVSTHQEVRDALESAGIPHMLVYPSIDLLNEWVGRCYRRGNDKGFIDNMIKNWDVWIQELQKESNDNASYELQSGEYLYDAMACTGLI